MAVGRRASWQFPQINLPTILITPHHPYDKFTRIIGGIDTWKTDCSFTCIIGGIDTWKTHDMNM